MRSIARSIGNGIFIDRSTMYNSENQENWALTTESDLTSSPCPLTEHLEVVHPGSFHDPILPGELVAVKLEEAVSLAVDELESFKTAVDFNSKLEIALGNNLNLDLVEEIWDDLDSNQVESKLVSGLDLGGLGAFGNGTIFLAEDFVAESNDPEEIAAVVLEEFGHYLDYKLNPNDAAGDEGEIFANFVLGNSLNEAELATLKAEDDSGSFVNQGQNIAVEYATAEDDGVFTVGATGQVTIDYLVDSGLYQGELGIFSLEGMEDLEPNSVAFRQEAANRALTNSTQGHVVITDSADGAKVTAQLGEANLNSGNYPHSLNFTMNAGELFGLILVPNGKIQEVADNPAIEGDKRPLFSLSAANPEGIAHLGQFVAGNNNGGIFALEDVRSDITTDKDYNDLIFQVRNATGKTAVLDSLMSSEATWQETELAQKLTDFATNFDSQEAFEILFDTLNLSQDTGVSSSDRITNNSNIKGSFTTQSQINSLKAGLNSTDKNSFVEISDSLSADGSFILDEAKLQSINGGNPLADGSYTLNLIATDETTNITEELRYSFTLDRQSPELTVINNSANESNVSNTVQLSGNVQDSSSDIAGISYLTKDGQAISIAIKENGEFNLDLEREDSTLELQNLQFKTTDIAGNITNLSVAAIVRTTDSGLQFIDLETKSGDLPDVSQNITVDYTGTFEDGTVFGDTRTQERDPFSFSLGQGQVIAGWDEGLATLTAGSRRQLIIPANLAYGTNGIPGVIPPNSTLIFDVELLNIG